MNDFVIEFEAAAVFQKDREIVSDITFTAAKNEFIYLIGKVGSGKSSILKTMYAELPLKQGKAKVAGFDLKQITNSEIPFLRRKLGIIFQDFQLLTDRNVFENLKFVLDATGWKKKDEIHNQIDWALNQVGLPDKKNSMPHQLSGGEQQRVVIARSLLNNPEIILADEPTGNLDPESSDSIMKILNQIAESGSAVIMATHNYNLIKKYKSKILKIENGKLEEISHNLLETNLFIS